MTALLRPVGRLLDLALPATCAGCGAEGAALCPQCLPAVRSRIALPPGTPMGLGEGPPHPLLQLEWCAPFGGTTRHALHALKYAAEQRLAVPLGEAVAERWRQAGAGGEILVPVPVHAQRRRERGYDQAVLLARVAAASLGLPCVEAVVRARATAPQFRLDRRHRAANMAEAFVVAPQARDRRPRPLDRAGGRRGDDGVHPVRGRTCAPGGGRPGGQRGDGRPRAMSAVARER